MHCNHKLWFCNTTMVWDSMILFHWSWTYPGADPSLRCWWWFGSVRDVNPFPPEAKVSSSFETNEWNIFFLLKSLIFENLQLRGSQQAACTVKHFMSQLIFCGNNLPCMVCRYVWDNLVYLQGLSYEWSWTYLVMPILDDLEVWVTLTLSPVVTVFSSWETNE
jgi:hypothetical protein